MESLLLILVILSVLNVCFGSYGGSPMEEKLETQIDSREPRSFPTTELMAIRPYGFPGYNQSDGEFKKVNWETYARTYWYEYRDVNMSCPQIPSGISATTDWSLMIPCLYGNVNILPKTIFVHTYMLSHFVESTLKFMSKDARFVLLSAGTDMTIPKSTGDVRKRNWMRGFSSKEQDNGGDYWKTLLNDKRVLHMFMENRDMGGPKVSTLPTGFPLDLINIVNNTYHSLNYEHKDKLKLPLLQRNLTVLTADRTRDRKGQWFDRAHVQGLCEIHEWCHPITEKLREGLTHSEFIKELHLHPFITCVHGGGVDPSPKAFEAIHEGTIPILKKTLVYDAYKNLPVAWVDSWDDLFTVDNIGINSNHDLLNKWRTELAPYYEEGSHLREQTLNRLKLPYWRGLIQKAYENGIEKEKKEKEKSKRRQRKRKLMASTSTSYDNIAQSKVK